MSKQIVEKRRLDVRGLNCPLPVLHARKAMNGLAVGAVLEVLATDPSAAKDFDAYCRKTNSDLLSQREEDGVFTFEIRKGAA